MLIGIDVGTTHLKAAVFSESGEQLAIAHVPTPTNRTPEGGAEYDPEAIWEGVAACLRQVAALGRTVKAVGIASMAEAGVLVGPDGKAAYPAIAWFDPRTRPQAEVLSRSPGLEALYLRTGLFVMPKHGLCKILWLKEHHPELFQPGTTWLNMAEWVAFKLTGNRAACPTLGARTLAMDLASRSWATDLTTSLGLPHDLFAPLTPEGTPTGTVTTAAAATTGLPAGTNVALAGHDHPCAALAAGVTGPGQMLDSTGTAEAVIGAVAQPILTRAAIESQISQGPLPIGGLYGLQAGAAASGGSLEWFKREFFPDADYAALTAAALESGEEPSGILFLPHLAGGGPPSVDPASKGAFIGLTYGATRGHMVKAVLEGTCFELRRMVDAMERLVGTPFTRVVVTGGHAHNPLWLQLKADILGRPLAVPDVPEATLLGAALLAGGVQTAARPERIIQPRPAISEAYQKRYETYRGLAEVLRPLYHRG